MQEELEKQNSNKDMLKNLLAKKFKIELSKTSFAFSKKDYNEDVLGKVMNEDKFKEEITKLNKVIQNVWVRKKENDEIKITKKTLSFTIFSLVAIFISVFLLTTIQTNNEYCQEHIFTNETVQRYYLCSDVINGTIPSNMTYYNMEDPNFKFADHPLLKINTVSNDITYFISFSLITAAFLVLCFLTIQNYKRNIKTFRSIQSLIEEDLNEYISINNEQYVGVMEFHYDPSSMSIEITVFKTNGFDDEEAVDKEDDKKEEINVRTERNSVRMTEPPSTNNKEKARRIAREKFRKMESGQEKENLKDIEKDIINNDMSQILDKSDIGLKRDSKLDVTVTPETSRTKYDETNTDLSIINVPSPKKIEIVEPSVKGSKTKTESKLANKFRKTKEKDNN